MSTSEQAGHDTVLTEAEFLRREARDAQAAMLGAMVELKSQIAAGVDPRGWVEDHPWVTLAGVAAASFVATTIAVPSKEQQALHKLAAIESALHRSAPESAKRNGHGDGKAEKSLLAMVLMELFGALKPFLGQLAANLVRQPKEPDDQAAHPR
jgi:hypothetical protein